MIASGKLQPGDVLVHNQFEFPDGSVAPEKLLVVVGERAATDVLLFICTSQEKHGRHKKAQCQPQDSNESSFFLPARKGSFSKDTWIMLEPYQFTSGDLVARLGAGRCYRAFSLAQHELQALRNCFRRCWEFSPIYDQFN